MSSIFLTLSFNFPEAFPPSNFHSFPQLISNVITDNQILTTQHTAEGTKKDEVWVEVKKKLRSLTHGWKEEGSSPKSNVHATLHTYSTQKNAHFAALLFALPVQNNSTNIMIMLIIKEKKQAGGENNNRKTHTNKHTNQSISGFFVQSLFSVSE